MLVMKVSEREGRKREKVSKVEEEMKGRGTGTVAHSNLPRTVEVTTDGPRYLLLLNLFYFFRVGTPNCIAGFLDLGANIFIHICI